MTTFEVKNKQKKGNGECHRKGGGQDGWEEKEGGETKSYEKKDATPSTHIATLYVCPWGGGLTTECSLET